MSMNSIDCCAILVNYHGAMDTAQAAWTVCVDQPEVDICVVDNSQSETEANLLRSLLPAKARVMIAPENMGFGRACNWAFDACAHEFVLLVNPDVRLLPGCSANLLHAMQMSEGLAAVAPRQFFDDACRWMLSPSWFPTALRAWAMELAQRNVRYAHKMRQAVRSEALSLWHSEAALAQRALSGGVMMIRRRAIVALAQPLFDPQFFMYFEDSDLCRRLKNSGWQLAVEPRARAIHHWRNQPHKGVLMAQSSEQYFAKYPAPHWRAKAAQASSLPAIDWEPSASLPKEGIIVPEKWRDGWVLELGLNPLFIPSIGRLGAGSVATFPHDIVANFEGAQVFARLGATNAHDTSCLYFELS